MVPLGKIRLMCTMKGFIRDTRPNMRTNLANGMRSSRAGVPGMGPSSGMCLLRLVDWSGEERKSAVGRRE